MVRLLKKILSLVTDKPEQLKNPGLNETLKTLFNRRSCRNFNNSPITPQEVDTIVDAGRFAPSTVNLQTWSFITFSKEDWRRVFDNPIPFKAQYAVVICADLYKLKNFFPDFFQTPCVNILLSVFNAGLAAMNMTLAAESMGIKSIMLSETGKTGLLDIDYLQDKLTLPEFVFPVTTLVLGRTSLSLPGIPPRQPRHATAMHAGYDSRAGDSLKDWYDTMFIGYKLTHPFSTLDKQVAYYRKKMQQAEESLKKQFTGDS